MIYVTIPIAAIRHHSRGKALIPCYRLPLSHPPGVIGKITGHPGVCAGGDDGNENAKAALHALKKLDGGRPTVAFFITDAGYHRTRQESPTAHAEHDYLVEKGVDDSDFYAVFDLVSNCYMMDVGTYGSITMHARHA